MKKINEILGCLPAVIYFGYILLLSIIYLNLEWYLKYDSAIELTDFIFCAIMLIHALHNFKNYTLFNKTSFVTIVVLSIFHLFYYKYDIPNKDYYTIYIIILASNLIYALLNKIIKK